MEANRPSSSIQAASSSQEDQTRSESRGISKLVRRQDDEDWAKEMLNSAAASAPQAAPSTVPTPLTSSLATMDPLSLHQAPFVLNPSPVAQEYASRPISPSLALPVSATLSKPREYLTTHEVPAIQMVPIDIATLLDVDERDFARLAVNFENYDSHLFNSNQLSIHPFYVLVNAYKNLEQARVTTSDAAMNVRSECQVLEPLLWTLEDQTIVGQQGTCLDGNPVLSAPFTYQIAKLHTENAEKLSTGMNKLHSLMYSNLHDVTTKCEVWAELVKSRCTDLVNKSGTLANSSTTDIVPLLPPNALHTSEIAFVKDYLNILFYFERITPKPSEISRPASTGAPASTASDMSAFLKTLHWCIQYLIAIFLRNATEDDHHWILRRLVHTTNITEWGKEFLQVPGLLKSRQGLTVQQRYEGAQYYVSAMRRLLSPILDQQRIRLPDDLPRDKALDFVKERALGLSNASNDGQSLIFVLTESDFLSMLSQFSLGRFLSAFTDSTLDDVRTQLTAGSTDAMEFVSRAASVLSIFEDLINVIISAIPLVVFEYVDVGKKLADMLVKSANRALNFVSELLRLLQLPPPHVSSMVKSKAEQLLFRAFGSLLEQPALWQFLVHLDLASASLDVVSCLFSSVYFDNPTRFNSKTLNIASWKQEIAGNPAMRSLIVERLTTQPTSSYLIYSLTRMMTTHLGSSDFIRVVLYELFSLAYTIEETSDHMQKHIRDQIAPVISTNPILISLLIDLTDSHLARIGYGCFHPWKGLNLTEYQLPNEDLPTLKKWLVSKSPDTCPEHHLAKFILASIPIDCGSSHQAIFHPDEIRNSPLQRRLASLLISSFQEFSTAPGRTYTHLQSFSQFCSTLLLRTFHHDYLNLSSYPGDFDQSLVPKLASIFTACMPSGFTGGASSAHSTTALGYGQICSGNMDPITAFGLVELTGLAGASSQNAILRTVPQLNSAYASAPGTSASSSHSDIDLCVRAFFDCAVPAIAGLIANRYSLQMSYRLAFDATIVVAPFIALHPAFSSPDWSNCPLISTSLATFANYIALPLLQIPSLLGSMSTMIKGSVPYLSASAASTSATPPPPLINLISAQYSLCRNADANASYSGPSPFSAPTSPSSPGPTSSSLGLSSASQVWYPTLSDDSPYGGPFDNNMTVPGLGEALATSADNTRTSSLLAFWIKSLMLIKDWYTIPQVLDAVELCFELLHEAGIFQLGVELASQAESFAVLPLVASRRSSTTSPANSPGALPKILTALLGTIATPKSFISSLFASAAVDQVTHPWLIVALFQSFARTQLYPAIEDIGLSVSTTLVPGQSSPMNLSILKTALLPLQPYFEALTKSILVIEPAHPSSILYWNLFLRLFFSHCSVHGQTLFYGFTLFQTSPSKTRRDKITARINFFVNHFTTTSTSSVGAQPLAISIGTTQGPGQSLSPASSSQNLSSASSRIQQTATDEKGLKVQLRELYASMKSWLSIPIHTFNTLPAILAAVPMGHWLSQTLGKDDLKSSQASLALTPKSIPQLEGRVSSFTLYVLQPTKDTIKIEAYMPTTRTTVDLMELLKVFGLERLESIRQLRKEKKAAYQTIHDDDEGDGAHGTSKTGEASMSDSSVGVPALPGGERSQFDPFDVASPDFLQQVAECMKTLRQAAQSFVTRRQTHLSLLDRRLQLLQEEKRNQPQMATANAPCKLGEGCKGPVEFKLQISRVVSDLQTQKELQMNVDQLFALVTAINSRDTEAMSNTILVRFLRTMYSVFGEEEAQNSAVLSSVTPGVPDSLRPTLASTKASMLQKHEATFIQLYWLLRDFHASETINFSPSLHLFNLLERQLLQKIVVKNNLQVGRALYTLVEDPWASVALKDVWNPSAASPMEQFHMLEYLWTQPLPLLSDASRASLLSAFDIVQLFTSLNADLQKDCISKLLDILKAQLIFRAQSRPSVATNSATRQSSQHQRQNSAPQISAGVDFTREIQDVMHSLAIAQMAQIAGYEFPANVGPVLQFMFDESRKRMLHPSAWDAVLLLPYARDANAPGLSPSKLQSLLTFVPSYMEMFKSLNPANHLAQWAPYMGKYLVLLKQLGYCLLYHLHSDREQSKQERSEPKVSEAPAEQSDAKAIETSSPLKKTKTTDVEAILKSFLDLYTMWIVKPAGDVFESWDTASVEPIALMISESLQQIMYYIIVGPMALTVPSTTFVRRFKSEVLFNASFLNMFSPHSHIVLLAVSKYLFTMINTPSLPIQRATLLERTPFWNLPFSSLVISSKDLYLSLLQTIQQTLSYTKTKAPLFRLVYKIAMSMVPEMSSEFQNPLLLSASLDSDALGIILDMAFMAITYLRLPYEQDEAVFWKQMVKSLEPAAEPSLPGQPPNAPQVGTLPWSRMAPAKLPSVDDASGSLRDLHSIVQSYCQKKSQYFVGGSGFDVSRAGDVRTAADSDRAFQALWLLRAFVRLSSSHEPQKLPYVISMFGLTGMRFVPNADDWRNADDSIRNATLVSRVFASQSLLLASTCNLEDPQIWSNPPHCVGGILGPMLHFTFELSNILYALSSSSAPPISAEARNFLQATCQLPPHVPDSIAYPVLWSNLLTKILVSALSFFNHLESVYNARIKPSASPSSLSVSASSSATSSSVTTGNSAEPLFALLRMIDCVLQAAQQHQGITMLLLPVLLGTVTNLPVLARLTEGLLEIDWNSFKSFSRLSEALFLPPSLNAPQLRQSLFSINGLLSFTVMQQQLLQKEDMQEILKFEPEMRHWCAAALLLPGREIFALSMWYKAIQLYVLLLRSNVQQVAAITGNHTTSTFSDQLFKLAQNMFTKTDSKVSSDSALMRFIGVKKASPLAANFRLATQLLAVFLFEHLLETPVLGPGNKIIGSNVSVRNHTAFNIVDEAQEKRKQFLLESARKAPNNEFAGTITPCIQFISRPQKSLLDVDEIWKMLGRMFAANASELLLSLAP